MLSAGAVALTAALGVGTGESAIPYPFACVSTESEYGMIVPPCDPVPTTSMLRDVDGEGVLTGDAYGEVVKDGEGIGEGDQDGIGVGNQVGEGTGDG